MKGIILHGGHGTRLRPLTHTGPKQLLKIANKPMSQYALEDLRDAGITDIAIIIGDVYPEKVKEFYGDGTKFGVKITYVFQDHPKGIAHAIGLCKEFVGNEKSRIVALGSIVSIITLIIGVLLLGEYIGLIGMAFSLVIAKSLECVILFVFKRKIGV